MGTDQFCVGLPRRARPVLLFFRLRTFSLSANEVVGCSLPTPPTPLCKGGKAARALRLLSTLRRRWRNFVPSEPRTHVRGHVYCLMPTALAPRAPAAGPQNLGARGLARYEALSRLDINAF